MEHICPRARFPLFVVHLDVPNDWIDINVHPQKKEIRFFRQEQIYAFVRESVEKALLGPKKEKAAPPPTPKFSFPIDLSSKETPLFFSEPAPSPVLSSQKSIIGRIGNFLLLEEMGQFYALHLQRAKRIMAICALQKDKKSEESQILLQPLSIECSSFVKEQILAEIDLINDRGISLSHFGGNTFLIDALPVFIAEKEVEEILQVFADLNIIDAKRRFETAVDQVLKKKLMEPSRVDASFVEAFFQCEEKERTPDGKPTLLPLDEAALASFFN